MQFIRKSLVGLAASLLTAILFGLGVSWSLQHVFGTSNDIKAALRDAKFYDSVVSNALEQVQKSQNQNKQPGEDTIPVNQPEIRSIIQQTFPPEFLQSQTEQVLDSIFSWIHNDNKTPLSFSIDLTDAKQRLANGVGAYVTQHLSSLPACTRANLPASGDVDVFTATCVPPGYNITKAAVQARDQILNGDFLKDSKISSDTIKNDKGETLGQQLHQVPQVYHYVGLARTLSVVLAGLLAVAIVFLSATWRNGLRRVAIILLSVGVVSALVAWVVAYGLHRTSGELVKRHLDGPWQNKLLQIAEYLAKDLRHWWMLYGIVLAVVGIVTLLVIHFVLIPRAKDVLTRSSAEDDSGTRTEAGHTADDTSEHVESKVKTEPIKTPRPDRRKLIQ